MTLQTASSLAEFYADPASPYAGFPQEHRSGGSMPVSFIRSKQQTHEITHSPRSDIVLVLVLVSRVSLSCNLGNGWTASTPMIAGDLNFLPACTSASFDARGAHEVVSISIALSSMSSLLQEHNLGSIAMLDPLTAAIRFRDEPLRRTAMQMWAESARSGGTADLLMDGLTQVLIARLLDKAGALRKPQIILPLSQAELTRLDEMIDARIAERLTVEDLAQTLDMPRWTFADAFKATTGDTPHSYVTGKRVERACELLRIGDMPLAEIAYATGFASQSHMTDTFRRVLGTTPGKWRKEARK